MKLSNPIEITKGIGAHFGRLRNRLFSRIDPITPARVESTVRSAFRASHHRAAAPWEIRLWTDAVESRGWSLRAVRKAIFSIAKAHRRKDIPYSKWIRRYDTISNQDRLEIRRHIGELAYQPLISVVMPVYDPPEQFLLEAVASVERQLYGNWELCIADDASTQPYVREILTAACDRNSRIKCVWRSVNGNISEASNSALTLAAGEFIALIDHDDVIPEHALYEVAAELNRHPNADIIYSDEDRIGGRGDRHAPYFKPDWNPELLLGQNFISHLGVYRRSLVEAAGGFRPGFEGSQDYDLALRTLNLTSGDRIRHIPAILYHWRLDDRGSAFSRAQLEKCCEASRRAKNDFFASRNDPSQAVAHSSVPQYDRIVRRLPAPPPLVSIVVPTRNRHELLGPCIDGLLHRTNYSPIEILIVDNESDEPETLALLARLSADSRVRIISYAKPFNYSDMNNMAVAEAHGEIVALLNNDIEVIDRGWLNEMVSLAVRPENGAIGAKLLYKSGAVQHAGVVLGMDGAASHVFRNRDSSDAGYFGRLAMTSNYSAVTGACLLVRKQVFELAGGLNATSLPVAFNDIDFCLKVRAAGYRNVWTPFAVLYHHESASRGYYFESKNSAREEREAEFFRLSWPNELRDDPAYNPNLSLVADWFGLASPPRRKKPWKAEAATA